MRSNNGGANANGSGALSNVGGNIVGNNPTGSTSGSLNAGVAGTGLDIFYEIYQLSADYRITPQWRVGGLWGTIKDTTGQSKGSKGWALASYYDLNSNVMLYALLDSIDNQQNGNWGPRWLRRPDQDLLRHRPYRTAHRRHPDRLRLQVLSFIPARYGGPIIHGAHASSTRGRHAQKQKSPSTNAWAFCLNLVAGAGFEPATFGL